MPGLSARTSAGVVVNLCKCPENYANSTSAQHQTNGRRTGLKIRSPQEGVGSSPTFGTFHDRVSHKQILISLF